MILGRHSGELLRVWQIIAELSGVLLLTGPAASGGPSPTSSSAAGYWADGDVEGALAALGASHARESELNRAVVRLYAGEAAEVLPALATLHGREPRWTPALRWLARAQEDLGRPEAVDSARALLRMPGVGVLDQLWAGRLFLKNALPQPARSAFLSVIRENDGIELAWVGLAEAETRLGHVEAARRAHDRAALFHGGEPMGGAPASAGESAPDHMMVPPGLRPGERLTYQVKYLFFRLASVTLETGSRIVQGGEPAYRVVLSARSNPAIPFFHVDSRFESVLGEDGAVLVHRHVADDSDAGADQAGYDMDRETLRCTVRTVREGVFGYVVRPLPPNAQDGVSMLLVARAMARRRGSAVIPTMVDSLFWPTQLRTLGTERIRWRGRQVQAVRMQSSGHFRGPGGLSGALNFWISDDEAAVPYRVEMKIGIGSVVLELLPDPPVAPARAHADGVSP